MDYMKPVSAIDTNASPSGPPDADPARRVARIPGTIGYYAAFVALGLASASLGPTLPGLALHTQSRLAQISSLFAARSLGYLVGSLLGGRLYDRIPGHPVMALAALAAGLLIVVGFSAGIVRLPSPGPASTAARLPASRDVTTGGPTASLSATAAPTPAGPPVTDMVTFPETVLGLPALAEIS